MIRSTRTRRAVAPWLALGMVFAAGLACRPEPEEPATEEPGPSAEAEGPGEITIRFQVAGLASLVPSEEGDSLAVLVIDAAEDFQTHTGCMVPGHDASLEWHAGGCEGCFSDDPNHWLQPLQGADIHLRLVGAEEAPSPLSLGGLGEPMRRPADQPEPPLGPEWVFHPGELSGDPSYAAVKDGCFANDPTTEGCPLAARLRVDHGVLRTCRLSELDGRSADESVPVYDFQPLPEGAREGFTPRPLAHAVELEWTARATGLEIWTTPFGEEAEEAFKITLTPDDEGEIVVALFNRLRLPPNGHYDPPPGYCDMDGGDPHFDHYYRIAAAAPDPHPLPHHSGEYYAATVQPDCTLLVPPDLKGSPNPPNHSACVKKQFSAHEGVKALEP